MLKNFWKENRVGYAAGPGDVVGTFRHWLADHHDPREHAVTYSGTFLNWCQEKGVRASVRSSCLNLDHASSQSISVSNKGSHTAGKSGIAYHLGRLRDALSFTKWVLQFQPAKLVATGDDIPNWTLCAYRLMGINVIRSLHCRLPQHKGLRRIIENTFFRFSADGFLVVSQSIEDDVKKIGVKENTPIERFYPQFHIKQPHPVRSTNSIWPRSILFVGRIERNKGIFDLLDAFKLLNPTVRKQCALEFVGNGSALEALANEVRQKGLAQQVFFHGHLEKEELSAAYENSSVVVVPTRSDFVEGFNKVVIEGLLYGKKVVASDQCPSAIEFSEYLEVYQANDVKTLQTQIEQALQDDSEHPNSFYFNWHGSKRPDWASALSNVIDHVSSLRSKYASKNFPNIRPVSNAQSVCVVAEQCNPEWPSVPRVTFQLIRHLAEHVNITLVTHERNQKAITKTPFIQNAIFVKEPNWVKRYYSWIVRFIPGRASNWPLFHAFTYPVFDSFDRRATSIYKELESKGHRFDLIWALSPILPRYPYRLAQETDRAPMMLGPVNGGLPFPKGFVKRSLSEFSAFNFLRVIAEKNPTLRKTYQHSNLVLSGSRFTEQLVNARLGSNSVSSYFPENGIDDRFFSNKPAIRKDGEPLKLLFVGRLTPYKGADMLIQALAKLKQRGIDSIELRVVGDGSQLKELQDLSKALELDDQITWVGRIPPEAVSIEYQKAHAFVFPSIREFGGAVVIEAMASGLPCVISDYGGIGEFVTHSCGFKTFPKSPESMINFLAQSVHTIWENEALRQKMGAAAIKEAQQHKWSNKANLLKRSIDTLTQWDAYRAETNTAQQKSA